MVQKQVFKDQERCIYQIQEGNFHFYMIIPNCFQLSLVLGLMKNVEDQQIMSIPKVLDKAIVVPILDEKILMGVVQKQVNYFDWLDKYFSSLLNLAHKILVHNKITVNSMVYFSSNIEYLSFQNWFIERHKERVQSIELFQKPVVVQNLGTETSKTVSVENTSIDVPLEKEILTEKNMTEEVEPTKTKEPGFVSYVLLGVLVAVLSLIFLYFII